MFEPGRFAFLVVVVFLMSNYGVQCYYLQPNPYAPYSPYSQPYPYMGQYAPVQPPSWNQFYPPHPYGPSAAVPDFAPASVPAAKPIDILHVATPAPESPLSPSLPIIDFKKGSIIDYEYFYDTLPEDFGKTRMIIMLNKTSSATVTPTQTPTVTSKSVVKTPSTDLIDVRYEVDATEKVVDELTEATTEEVTPETTEIDLDISTSGDETENSNSDEVTTDEVTTDEVTTDEVTTDEVTTEELIEDTTVTDDVYENYD